MVRIVGTCQASSAQLLGQTLVGGILETGGRIENAPGCTVGLAGIEPATSALSGRSAESHWFLCVPRGAIFAALGYRQTVSARRSGTQRDGPGPNCRDRVGTDLLPSASNAAAGAQKFLSLPIVSALPNNVPCRAGCVGPWSKIDIKVPLFATLTQRSSPVHALLRRVARRDRRVDGDAERSEEILSFGVHEAPGTGLEAGAGRRNTEVPG